MTRRLVIAVFTAIEVVIWPAGIWMMATGYNGHSPDEIGRAMVAPILLFALPILWAIDL